jgi:putative FmdB family regulatory protein
MPFYEYQCAACGHHHEELQKVSDRALRKCPACGRPSLKRLVSAPVFRLKGGGWYETDFKNDKEAKRNIAGDKEPAASDSAGADKPKDDKADAKPADKKTDAAPAAKPAQAAAKKPKPVRSRAARRRPARR